MPQKTQYDGLATDTRSTLIILVLIISHACFLQFKAICRLTRRVNVEPFTMRKIGPRHHQLIAGQMQDTIKKRAKLSRCKQYRYLLERSWGSAQTVVVIGLNPSTADAYVDDPTVRRCIGFARDWGYDRLLMVNLFAYRSTQPSALLDVADPIGPSNDRILQEAIAEADCVVAAWGAKGGLLKRDQIVLAMLGDVHCIGLTASGMPRHPLYMPATSQPVPMT